MIDIPAGRPAGKGRYPFGRREGEKLEKAAEAKGAIDAVWPQASPVLLICILILRQTKDEEGDLLNRQLEEAHGCQAVGASIIFEVVNKLL